MFLQELGIEESGLDQLIRATYSIALFATQIHRFVPQELMDAFITEMTATGGIMIFAIGLNLVGITKIRVANLLPGIVVVGVRIIVKHTTWSRHVPLPECPYSASSACPLSKRAAISLP